MRLLRTADFDCSRSGSFKTVLGLRLRLFFGMPEFLHPSAGNRFTRRAGLQDHGLVDDDWKATGRDAHSLQASARDGTP